MLYLFQLEELQNVPEKSQRELQKLEEKKNDLEVQDHRMPTISALQSYHENFPTTPNPPPLYPRRTIPLFSKSKHSKAEA